MNRKSRGSVEVGESPKSCSMSAPLVPRRLFKWLPCRQARLGTVGHRIASERGVHPIGCPLDLAGQDLLGSVAGDAAVIDRPKLRHLGA